MNYRDNIELLEGIDKLKHSVHYLNLNLFNDLMEKFGFEKICEMRDSNNLDLLSWMLYQLENVKIEPG